MFDRNHIGDRIALSLLVTGVVLASAGVGTLGVVATTSQAAAAATPMDASDQRVTLSATPSPNAAPSATALAFPIDNVTVSHGVSGFVPATTTLGQDMDPYALGQDMDPY